MIQLLGFLAWKYFSFQRQSHCSAANAEYFPRVRSLSSTVKVTGQETLPVTESHRQAMIHSTAVCFPESEDAECSTNATFPASPLLQINSNFTLFQPENVEFSRSDKFQVAVAVLDTCMDMIG